jgi:hypothetical protein
MVATASIFGISNRAIYFTAKLTHPKGGKREEGRDAK